MLYQTGAWILLLHDNVRRLTVIPERDFIAKRRVTVFDHPLYSPDQEPLGFLLFMKGLHCVNVSEIQQHATAIPDEAFADNLQQLYQTLLKVFCG